MCRCIVHYFKNSFDSSIIERHCLHSVHCCDNKMLALYSHNKKLALCNVGSEINVRALLPSLSAQPASPRDLLPFCGKLNIDEKLQLSHKNFKHLIEEFYKDKFITPLSQLTATPPFPTPHVLAQFASKAYTDYKKQRLTLSMRHG